MNDNHLAFSTRAVHAGERREGEDLRPVVGPIHPSVGYTFADSRELDAVLGEEQPGYVYSTRYANPTVAAFESAVANLEGMEAAYAFSSGMAAVHLALLASGVRAGTAVVAAADIYGATYTLLQELFAALGAVVHFVDITDGDQVRQALERVRPRALLVETISNPLLKVADLARLAELAHATEAKLLVDNTFCTPYLCNPSRFGADVVIHSATKYLAGHGDVMGGVVVCSAALRAELVTLNKMIGSSLGPFEAWLALRGLKTLPLRMARQCTSALAVAGWLQQRPEVTHVHYPGLADHPQHRLLQALTQGRGAGGVVSFVLRDAGRDEVFAFMDALRLVQPATTLGDIYSLVLYPAISSHRGLTATERAALGIGEGLVRLSVGLEDPDDIQDDLAQALAVV
ncbi:MAG: PLP-dependent aspartate aminotransferase family protein [Candidatus Promineifilaceae bacterium]|nr:PLP-dependent aspartate aminotransferase family protein [Candidatus Promineifilaceae bacterium]